MTIPQILLTPPWQDKASRIKAPKLPESLVISELPKLFLKDNPVPLSDENMQNLLGLLFKSDIKQWVEPLTDDSVKALLAEFEPNALHDFANALAKQVGIDWYGYAVLSPFDFATVETLRGFIDGKTERTDDNPLLFDKKFSQTSLAKQLIRLLTVNFRMTGSPHALQTLFLQQQKGKKTYRNFCLDTLTTLGEEIGLNLLELQDVAVPNFGFINGKRMVQLDEHELQLRLDPHFQILVYQEGTLIKNFPKIGKNDDKVLWKQTLDEIKEQQKQLNKLSRELPKVIQNELKYQYYRQFSHFRDNYLNHPVLNQFAQTLVWALFEEVIESGKPIKEFRYAFLPSNDGSWLNSDYEDIKPTIEKTVTVNPESFFITPLHPAFISDSEQTAFSQMLMDFEIMQPCQQMALPTYRPTEVEWKNGLIERFNGSDLSYYHFASLHYSQSFQWLYGGNQEVGFALGDKHGNHIKVTFAQPVEAYNTLPIVQVQPIAISADTNRVLLHNVLQHLTQAYEQALDTQALQATAKDFIHPSEREARYH